jgi:hypothetical protein
LLEKKNVLGFVKSFSGCTTGVMRIWASHHIVFTLQKHHERFTEHQSPTAIFSYISHFDTTALNSQSESDACTNASI